MSKRLLCIHMLSVVLSVAYVVTHLQELQSKIFNPSRSDTAVSLMSVLLEAPLQFTDIVAKHWLHALKHYVVSNLSKYIEAKVVDVVDVTQSKQAGKKATGQHAHRKVQSNGKALPDDATAWGQQTISYQLLFVPPSNKWCCVLCVCFVSKLSLPSACPVFTQTSR